MWIKMNCLFLKLNYWLWDYGRIEIFIQLEISYCISSLVGLKLLKLKWAQYKNTGRPPIRVDICNSVSIVVDYFFKGLIGLWIKGLYIQFICSLKWLLIISLQYKNENKLNSLKSYTDKNWNTVANSNQDISHYPSGGTIYGVFRHYIINFITWFKKIIFPYNKSV